MPSRTKTVFTCWRCQEVLVEFDGEEMILSYMICCENCKAANAIVYAFPLAPVSIVDNPLYVPEETNGS